MIMYGSWIWEGLSTETKPGEIEGAKDGHIFKELDTGESYARINGRWQFINLGLSFIKTTKSGTFFSDVDGSCHIVFTTSFIDDQYTVALSTLDVDSNKPVVAHFKNLTKNGFDIQTRVSKNGNPVAMITGSWLATRNYNP